MVVTGSVADVARPRGAATGCNLATEAAHAMVWPEVTRDEIVKPCHEELSWMSTVGVAGGNERRSASERGHALSR